MKKVASTASKKRKKGPTSDEEREEEAAKDARRQRTLGGGRPIPGVTGVGLGAAGPSSDPSPPPKKKATKAYVPRKGSGSYAILLALYMNASFDEHQVWTLKVKVIEDATPYSDTSLVKASTTRNGGNEPATGFYSAFSNMKARESAPARSCRLSR